jgi:hypothetical protein
MSKQRNTYEFSLLLEGPDVLSEDVFSALDERCDDAIFGHRGRLRFADFEREADSFEEAVVSAISDVERSADGLRVVRVQPDELVTATTIADRVGRSTQSINQLAGRKRRKDQPPFPGPVAWVDAKTRLWRWSDVVEWFARMGGEVSPDDVATAEFIALINGHLEVRRHKERLAEISEARADEADRAMAMAAFITA